MIDGVPFKFKALPEDKKKLIEQTKLLAYICEGTESEIKEWFEIINIGGVKLNEQEKLNAIYSGPFVCGFSPEFSNKADTRAQKWGGVHISRVLLFLYHFLCRQLLIANSWTCPK